MSAGASHPDTLLAAKIARLVQERGWNQEDFARITHLNRHTVRQILRPRPGRRLRNATVLACAQALGLTVHELRSLPLERLLPRMRGVPPAEGDDQLKRLYEYAALPELTAWLERHPDRARRLTDAEIEQLLALQTPDGPLVRMGVEHVVELLERKRHLHQKVESIANTEYLPFLEQFVDLLAEKIRPSQSV
jgi:transcriptional regulator with XRE-family HTH domain